MGRPIISAEEFELRLPDAMAAEDRPAVAAIAVASDLIWRAMGAFGDDDFAYTVDAVERYRSRGAPTMRLRKRPIVEISAIRYYDINGTLIETLDPDTYTVIDAERGIIGSRLFPDTRATVETGYERRLVGRPLPLIEVVYTGGWVTGPQSEANASLTRNVPDDVAEACGVQALYLWNAASRDRSISSRSDEASSSTYRDPAPYSGGLLREVAAVCHRHRRRLDVLG